MPDIVRLTFAGNMGVLYRDDGSVINLIPSTHNQWIPDRKDYPTPPPGEPGSSILITAAMIEAAVTSVGGSLSAMINTSANIAAAYNDAIAATYPDILNSKNRVACLIGECAQETDWYKTTTEYGAGGHTYSPYDGRGFIQLTGSGNYASFGVWCKTIGLLTDATYFSDTPSALSDLKWAPYTAIYYFTQPKWASKNLFGWCDTSSTPWHDISRAINRGDPTSGSAAYGEALRATAIDAVWALLPDPTPPPTPTGLQDAVVAWEVAHIGDFRYSQAGGRRDPVASGYTDCSGLQGYVYATVAKKHIGWWTGASSDGQQQYGTAIQTGSGQPNESNMVKGDLVFFNWSGYNVNYDDVKMYMGANQVIGHGGPGNGPVIKSLSAQCAYAHDWRVRRYL